MKRFAAGMDGTDQRRVTAKVEQERSVFVGGSNVVFTNQKSSRAGVVEGVR
jgi:hypothetical protein